MREEWKEEKRQAERETVLHDVCPEPILCEASGEYTLPDYRPEIRKILYVRAVAMPAGQYKNGDKAAFAGAVSHTVFYADSEGKPAAVTLEADYEFSLPLPEGCTCTLQVDSRAENTACRLFGPRKLSLRTAVRSTVHLLCEEEITPAVRGMGSEEDEASLERLSARVETMEQACGSSGPFTLEADLHLDGPATGAEAVWAGGSLLVSECRPQAGGCLCRGHAWVRCLLREEEGLPYVVREKIPFEQLVPIAEAGERASCLAYGRLLAAEVELLPGEGEENGNLHVTVSAEIDACAVSGKICNPTSDLYSTDYVMACTYRPLTGTRSLGGVMGNYTVSGSRAREECDCEAAVTVVDADGRMEIHGVQVERGRAVVSGKLAVTVIMAAAEGSQPFPTAELSIPFRIETELRPAPGTQPRFDCHGELISVRARLEQSAVSADCEIALVLSATEERTVEILATAEPDRSLPVTHSGRGVHVVYPREEETLFSVGARYHKSRAAIAAQNGLGEEILSVSHLPESLDGVHHLLIED